MIDIETYQEMEDNMQGVCQECGAVRDMVEPDAEGYDCPECGANAVDGCDTMLVNGMVG